MVEPKVETITSGSTVRRLKKFSVKVSEHHQEKKVLYLVERYILRLMEDSSEGENQVTDYSSTD